MWGTRPGASWTVAQWWEPSQQRGEPCRQAAGTAVRLAVGIHAVEVFGAPVGSPESSLSTARLPAWGPVVGSVGAWPVAGHAVRL